LGAGELQRQIIVYGYALILAVYYQKLKHLSQVLTNDTFGKEILDASFWILDKNLYKSCIV
jgi:hypothetical protein